MTADNFQSIRTEIALCISPYLKCPSLITRIIFSGTNSISADVQEASEGASEQNEEFSSVVRENISSLQQVLQQEVGRLRHEFARD
jgi:hypothetical protein